jgi:hypothetical protein
MEADFLFCTRHASAKNMPVADVQQVVASRPKRAAWTCSVSKKIRPETGTDFPMEPWVVTPAFLPVFSPLRVTSARG